LFVCVGARTFEEPPTGLIPWFSKVEGNTYTTIAASPFPLQGKPTQAQDVAARRLFNHVWADPLSMSRATHGKAAIATCDADGGGVVDELVLRLDGPVELGGVMGEHEPSIEGLIPDARAKASRTDRVVLLRLE